MPPPRTYRWLARRTVATARKRHVFVEHADLSLCEYASRYNAHEQWLRDGERDACVICERELSKRPELSEAGW